MYTTFLLCSFQNCSFAVDVSEGPYSVHHCANKWSRGLEGNIPRAQGAGLLLIILILFYVLTKQMSAFQLLKTYQHDKRIFRSFQRFFTKQVDCAMIHGCSSENTALHVNFASLNVCINFLPEIKLEIDSISNVKIDKIYTTKQQFEFIAVKTPLTVVTGIALEF